MTDFHDAVLDARFELAADGLYLTTSQIVRATLDFEQSHDIYRHLSPNARHPFGLPNVIAAPTPGDHPTGPRPVSPPIAGAPAGGLQIPEAA